MLEVPKVVRLSHERGALVLLDAFQSVGSLPVDVKELDVDFLAAGVLKYLLGSAGIAGMELMKEIGIAETRAHVNELNSHLLDGLDELKATVVTPRRPKRRGALVCIRSTDAPALVAALGREGIVTSDRDPSLRISAHCYNSADDVAAVLASLRRH